MKLFNKKEKYYCPDFVELREMIQNYLKKGYKKNQLKLRVCDEHAFIFDGMGERLEKFDGVESCHQMCVLLIW